MHFAIAALSIVALLCFAVGERIARAFVICCMAMIATVFIFMVYVGFVDVQTRNRAKSQTVEQIR
jgi:hypothetical protein